jgi:hypothetical protein
LHILDEGPEVLLPCVPRWVGAMCVRDPKNVLGKVDMKLNLREGEFERGMKGRGMDGWMTC